ncbi:Protein kinase-like domain superfamily [Sesbania bispinosa]|nr:Protein kinase-like domain superfamily [Sesbania bispinosa]
MPSLLDLQGRPISGSVTWEAVLVNRAADSNLLKLEQKALELTVKSRPDSAVFIDSNLVRKLAILWLTIWVGPVGDPERMTRAWKSLSYSLKATLGSMVLPLGSLTIGLARHRALLFKVLADSLGIPSRLVKGLPYTDSDVCGNNFVKIDDGREYIVDLMADPGTLIPSDATGSHIEYDETFSVASPLSRDLDSSHVPSSSSGVGSSSEDTSDFGMLDGANRSKHSSYAEKESDLTRPTTGKEESMRPLNEFKSPHNVEKIMGQKAPGRPNHPYVHTRSSSWSEGISSPAVRRMKVKDVSQYMIDTAKENPHLAQKLHNVLLESGVVAPPNLFSDIYHEDLGSLTEANLQTEEKNEHKQGGGQQKTEVDDNLGPARFLPPLTQYRVHPETSSSSQPEPSKPVEGLGINLPLHTREAAGQHIPPQYEQSIRSDGDTDSAGYELKGSGDGEHIALGANLEGERRSDSSVVSNDSRKSDSALDDVAEYDIPWEENHAGWCYLSGFTYEDIISVTYIWHAGSYGEVYRGEWRGTEVAVKRFLDQDISGESLEEFKTEVQITSTSSQYFVLISTSAQVY